MTKRLSIATAALVLMLSLGGFVLSYNALWDMAYTYGVFPRLAWIWPLLIDFSMIVFSLAVFRASVLGERVGWAWLMVGLFTIATIAINILHVWLFLPELVVRIIVTAVPPVALFLSFETFVDIAKKEFVRSGWISRQETLIAELEATGNAMVKATSELEVIQVMVTSARNELEELNSRLEAGKKPVLPTVSERRKRVLEAVNAGKTQKEIAVTEGVSIKTIALDVKSLNGKVLVNG